MNLDIKISELNSVASLSHDIIGYATLVIVAGIVLELVILFIFTEGMSRNEKIALVVANILILIGLSTEYVYGKRLASTESEIQRISEDKLADARKSVAFLENENTKLKIKLIDLENLVQPRKIDEKQVDLIIRKLKGSGKPITIISIDDAEARFFALQLANALHKADFAVNNARLAGTFPYTGLIVCQRSSEDVAIYNVLKEAKFDVDLNDRNSAKRPDFCDRPGIEAIFANLLSTFTGGAVKAGETIPRPIHRGFFSFQVGPRIFVGLKPIRASSSQ